MCMLLHPYPCTYTFWKVSEFVHDAFFPISMKFGRHDIYQACRILYSSAPFLTPIPRKNLAVMAYNSDN